MGQTLMAAAKNMHNDKTNRKGCDKMPTWRDFPAFYQNEFIKTIAPNEFWTVSDDQKRPIDMFQLEQFGRVWGAQMTEAPSLTSLNRLCQLIPNAKNHAYYLDTLRDNYVVLDIEPTCPDNIKADLLKLDFVYAEYSMSGKGYHLVFPVPACFANYPIAQGKIVMKEEHGWYEILLNHYVTFTRNMLNIQPGTSDFAQLFEQFCANQHESVRADIEIADAPDDIPNFHEIVSALMCATYLKTPANFHNDASKYEYGFVGFMFHRLSQVLQSIPIEMNGHVYTDNDKAWILYTVAKDRIPYRDKHDEFRDNLPWLLYLCREIIAKNNGEANK